MTTIYVLVFHFLLRERRPKNDVVQNDISLYDIALFCSHVTLNVWIRLFYKHANIIRDSYLDVYTILN